MSGTNGNHDFAPSSADETAFVEVGRHYTFDGRHACRFGLREAILLDNLLRSRAYTELSKRYDERTSRWDRWALLVAWTPFWDNDELTDVVSSLVSQGLVEHRTSDVGTEISLTEQAWLALQGPSRVLPDSARITPRGSVYVLAAEDGSGRHKIGRSRNPKTRKADLQTQLPFKLRVALSFSCEDMAKLERELHARFAAKRLNGEWFDLTADDLADIRAYCTATGAEDCQR